MIVVNLGNLQTIDHILNEQFKAYDFNLVYGKRTVKISVNNEKFNS